jgi:hypothetical protein
VCLRKKFTTEIRKNTKREKTPEAFKRCAEADCFLFFVSSVVLSLKFEDNCAGLHPNALRHQAQLAE